MKQIGKHILTSIWKTFIILKMLNIKNPVCSDILPVLSKPLASETCAAKTSVVVLFEGMGLNDQNVVRRRMAILIVLTVKVGDCFDLLI